MDLTKEQVASAIAVVQTIAEAVRVAGKIPSGHLYAMIMDKVSIQAFESAVALLKRAGLVGESNHELSWTGPEIAR